ncbi:hypothetical protein [Phycicoccus elongatus]|uniref:hypothetical protein n=1 Tax=Phycicoccus elongatus TaxID=101689 RepID=UPI0037848564
MRTERAVGATAIALVVSVVIQNVVLASGAPTYSDPMTQVLTFHSEHRGLVTLAVGLEALNVPLLLAFVTGLHGLVTRRGRSGLGGSRLAVAAAATASSAFVLYAVLWMGVVLSARDLTAPTDTLEVIWRMHAAAFGFALAALGATFAGAAWAASASGLTRGWQRVLGLFGGGLMLVAGVASGAVAQGSSIIFVGVAGLAAWLVWLLVTGIRLVRVRAIGRSGHPVAVLSKA